MVCEVGGTRIYGQPHVMWYLFDYEALNPFPGFLRVLEAEVTISQILLDVMESLG